MIRRLFHTIQWRLSKATTPFQGGSQGAVTVNRYGRRGLWGASVLFILLLLSTTAAQAQVIGGNVYGGGNQANVGGNATVRVVSTDQVNKVFGGARMADIGGRTYVNIDGENAIGDIFITDVFGGNDISGKIGFSTIPVKTETYPTGLTEVLAEGETKVTHPLKNEVNDSCNVFVRTSRSVTGSGESATDLYPVIIGNLYGGGNGDYTYTDDEGNPLQDGAGNYIVKSGENVIATRATAFTPPELDRTYLELKGGCIAHAYGGGNNATINKSTTICINNESDVMTSLLEKYATAMHDKDASHTIEEYVAQTFSYLQSMTKLSTFQTNIDNTDFNFARVFGGNNKATMSIRPTWNLQQGRIRDLYSGGNKGSMTSPEGLLLDINPVADNKLFITNVFGGCRMADVRPLNPKTGEEVTVSNLDGYAFPTGLSARVLVKNGEITNVYGGNDITGKVFGGSAVGIYRSIYGDVYGGGNGAYAYTNREALKESSVFSDFYYPQIPGLSDEESLNAYRPNGEQVSIRLKGKDAAHRTIIKGSVFLGGNCASIKTDLENPRVELKIGSHVVADKVFLGNNGAGMIDKDILKLYNGKVDDNGKLDNKSGQPYSGLDLTDNAVFPGYMDGVTMELQPSIVFDSRSNGDPDDYEEYSSYIGSFYCGGNIGSMAIAGKNTYEVNKGLYISNKFVGGCNNANVPVIYDDDGTTPLNASFEGGVLGHADADPTKDERASFIDASGHIKDRLEINLKNLTILPLRWEDDTKEKIIWNTVKMGYTYEAVADGTTLTSGKTYFTSANGDGKFKANGTEIANGNNYFDQKATGLVDVPRDPSDGDIRLASGNVYGGCYESGHVNGNVVINIEDDVFKKEEVFGTEERLSGVELEDQRDDLEAVALTVFGAGYGEETEIWGSTTVNLNKGYAFQIFGGGEMGVVGKKKYDVNGLPVLDENDDYVYEFDPAYSSIVNLNGTPVASSADSEEEGLAETEYIYGGGNEGDVSGNTLVNLGNGRIYDAFAGASDADILGHAEVYIGRQPDGSGGYKDAFPWVRDIVYGGNDFGGTIHGAYEDTYDVTTRVKNYDYVKEMLHGYSENKLDSLLRSASYVEYLQGRVDTIFGGNYGYYDYSDEIYKDEKGNSPEMPYLHNSFVNIRPNDHPRNELHNIFGAGTGFPGYRKGDKSQDRSYILVDILNGGEKFANTRIYGSGSYNGLGMKHDVAKTFEDSFDPDRLSAIIDLIHGRVACAYGGSFNEGVTARTVINVPPGSTIQVDSIFGGAYGTQTLPPCDVFESNVNYASDDARLYGAIYGGNNSERRTLYAKVNISSPVWSNKDKGYLAKVYGAGHGENSWSEYTEVNLNNGAKVYEVYGGGELGHVLNAETVQKYMQTGYSIQGCEGLTDPKWIDAWTLGDYYTPAADFTNYADNPYTNLTNDAIVRTAEMDDRDYTGYTDGEKTKRQYKYNTNVLIHKGATVEGYAYGGGLGKSGIAQSGDVWGSTYIALLGGVVKKNLYAAGSSGGVNDAFGIGAYNASTKPHGFTASANAYIGGGSARNVFGGGWEGHVGRHTGDLSASYSSDIPGETHVVIGKVGGNSFFDGVPAVERNAYGGGEGGSIFGTANLTLNNGYIGYRYLGSDSPYYFTYSGSGPGDHPESDVLKAAGTALKDCFVEKIDDETNYDKDIWLGKESLIDCGSLYGSAYDDLSSVDITNVNLYGGKVRNCVFGGGEISIVGRGTKSSADAAVQIHKAGQTNVNMYDGHVLHNVYGGGKGYNTLGYGGGHNRYTDGYIFGQTRVNIRGGEIGTEEGVTNAEDAGKVGNVFGGGDAGLVYSAYELADGSLGFGKKSGERYNGKLDGTMITEGQNGYNDEGYYYKYENGSFVTEGGEKILTEDCKVVVEPWLKATTAFSFDVDGDGNKENFAAGDYVPTAYLNTLPKKDMTGSATGEWTDDWSKVDAGTGTDERGIIIHNAVFAGGNITVGSSNLNANTNTVFGNATASIHDVYNRDLITLGTGNIGGLYGDGNLTLVDGYRELNITNYGTDYYHINEDNETNKQIEYSAYDLLPEREKAYYEVRYKCMMSCTDNEHTTYSIGATLPEDELIVLFLEGGASRKTTVGNYDVLSWDNDKKKWTPNPLVWQKSGVVTMYAGRILNTIQRADFCGIFGSRMVMKGARDRIPEVVDYTKYTINRVREVSLNKKASHGNYFGIYSNVNFLGALSSDVDFGDENPNTQTGEEWKYEIRTTNNSNTETYQCDADGKAYQNQDATFYNWKKAFWKDRRRNNGNSHNQLALASGIYLELTQETSHGKDLYEKDWGPITGVIELDLINVATGIGGGYVYAKNEHGVRSTSDKTQTILTALNQGAITYKQFEYTTADATKKEWQTSGNFVHSTQTIIDDCYNKANYYKTNYDKPDGVPAHYWYINGQIYVYDQYISAYTGSSSAYQESTDIPLTITANSHGLLRLIDIQPNLYAYYADASLTSSLGADSKLVLNDPINNVNVTYSLNDPISYWDWSNLPAAEKALFVGDTYIVMDSCDISGVKYPAGTVLLKSEYNDLEGSTVYSVVNGKTTDKTLDFNKTFRSSNNVSHDNGYLLTYKMTNPKVWDTWYTQANSATHAKNQTGGTGYLTAPTYHLKDGKSAMILGQNEYIEGDIIHQDIYTAYQTLNTTHTAEISATGHTQATFGPAYIVTTEYKDDTRHLYPGATVSTSIDGYTTPAYVSTKTFKLSDDEYLYAGNVMTESEKGEYSSDIQATIVPAYYCTSGGYYGGNYFATGHNYDAQEAWSSMSDTERQNFEFNYDALDLLIDPNFAGTQAKKYQYDGNSGFNPTDPSTGNAEDMIYSLKKSVDYSATYNGTSLDLGKEVYVKHNGTGEKVKVSTIVEGDLLDRETYESLLNEQHHYSAITVKDHNKSYYVANTSFFHKKPYAAGQLIDADDWADIDATGTDESKNSVTVLNFEDDGIYYFCREAYTIATTGGKPVKAVVANTNGISSTGTTVSISKDATKEAGDEVPVGFIIAKGTGNGADDVNNANCYNSLPNQQVNFLIHGETPTETSTLYVARNSDIKDLSKEKIITVIYQYDYEESDINGNVTPISERHVVNIHLAFEDGEPSLGELRPPSIVLPGTSVTPKTPKLTTSAYEVIGGGWELYESEENAKNHAGGIPYVPAREPLYWYQDGYFIAYYAKTNVGKTYSNYVPVAVANYHDLAEVMSDLNKTHHMYVDHPKVQRESKIYINDYSESSQNGLDLLKDLYDLSLKTNDSGDVTNGKVTTAGSLNGHAIMDEHVKGGANLEFFLRTDIDHDDTWSPIAGEKDGSGNYLHCFSGTLHGDGHTIKGLDHSLFGNLCGDVYNLGVTGTFTDAGIVDEGSGYVESCWISTSSTEPKTAKPVFGNPNRNIPEKPYQIVNCYYQEEAGVTNAYTNHSASSTYGTTTRKPAKDFMNGTVAYDLNSFYLNKRYFDANKPGSTQEYKFLGTDATGKINTEMTTGYYPATPDAKYGNLDYVVDRFYDGDYRYAEGVIPTETDVRTRVVEEMNASTNKLESKTYFAPIWPDDYLFFGQMLTYGYGAQPHQDKPSTITKSEGRLPLGEEENSLNNRVYRAPAYFRNKNLSVAHFNFNAYFATQENPESVAEGKTPRAAYPGMTAIDFAGHQGNAWRLGTVTDGYPEGNPGFYPPLLDDDGLLSIKNCDETQNLLVYAPTEAANKKTYDVLTGYFTDPSYGDYYDNAESYRLVGDATSELVLGHLVQNDFTASSDHLLVDKQDFNAPMSYTFASGKRMWHQRYPDKYVSIAWSDHDNNDATPEVRSTKGWESVSLPFTAELVTTNQKGEITHFYSGSESSKNSTGTKIGHEYWLREFKGIKNETQEVSGTPTVVAVADLTYPTSSGSDADKTYKNSFLWDYYYEATLGHNHQDVNKDTYQTYYKPDGSGVVKTYTKYPLLATGTPYIIGFPGSSYYEFDLSGSFSALTTKEPHPEKLKQQVITFASNAGATIGVSDDELQGKKITYNGKDYIFRPSYMAETLESVSIEDAASPRSYALNSTGEAFDAVTREAGDPAGTGNVTTYAFRPFFTSAATGSSVKGVTRSIIFTNEAGDLGNDEEQEANRPGELIIRVRERKIYVTSTLSEEKAVTIVNSAGALINRFKIKPGETIVTDIHNPGIYLVNKTKLSVK